MNNFKRKKRVLIDRKNAFVFAFWMFVNRVLISLRFQDFQIIGRQNLPQSGPFLLVSNHVTRWDGLIVYRLIARPTNFMVSPNELRGLQGAVLSSMGSFPADPRVDLISHVMHLFKKGEGVVVFPEGNIFRDNITHPFKTGAAKIAQAAVDDGINLPIVPVAINYACQGKVAQIVIGQAVQAADYFKTNEEINGKALRQLSDRLYSEVCFLRSGLSSLGDRLAHFMGLAGHARKQIVLLSTDTMQLVESFPAQKFPEPLLALVQSSSKTSVSPDRKVS